MTEIQTERNRSETGGQRDRDGHTEKERDRETDKKFS